MNAITLALKTAGMPLPTQTERLWRIIKDHPGLTAVALSPKVGLKVANVSSICGLMVKRGMLVTDTVPLRVRSGHGYCVRDVLVYRVHHRMGGEYDLLPMPAKPKCEKVTNATPIAAAKPIPVSDPAPATTPDIDHLTLAQARNLYNVLHKLFGERA